MEADFRPLTDRERRLLDLLLTKPFPGRDEVAGQLQTAVARLVDKDGSLEFQTRGIMPLYSVRYAVPVEGEYSDIDGVPVHILLHAQGDLVTELEFFREDGSPVQSWPDLDSIMIYAPQ